MDQKEREALFNQELVPHIEALSRFAFGLTQDAQNAADLVQNTYIKAYRAIERFEKGSNAKAWLFTILRHLFYNQYKKQKRQPNVIDYDELYLIEEKGEAILAGSVDLRQDLFEDLLDDEMTLAINALPVTFRMPLLLYDLEGFTYDEIALITS